VTEAKVIDVSSWQHTGGVEIDWAAVHESGVQGVIVKLTQGTTYLNPYAVADLHGAALAGLLIGVYHFAQPGQFTPQAEAAWFLEQLGGLELELGAWLDLEDLGGKPAHELGPWCEEWLGQVQTPSRPSGLYTDRSIFGQLVGAPWGYRLWLAVPGADAPTDSNEWMTQTGSGAVPGVTGNCDTDTVWNARGLNLPVGGTTPPPVAPPPPHPAPQPTEGTCTVQLVELSITDAPAWDTKALQLVLRGFDGSIEVDGIFGPQTESIVKAFQGKCGLVEDGIVGPATWGVLLTGRPQ
jgi:lysozyme